MFSKLMALKIDDVGREKSLAFMVFFSFVVMMLGSSRSIYGVYMPDDFLLASQKMPMSFYLNQGRFIQAVITGFFNYIDINIVSSSPIFTPLFFISTSLASSFLVFFLLEKRASLFISCLLSGVIVSHPTFSMMAVYHLAVVCFALCMICIVGYMILFDNFIKTHDTKPALTASFFVLLICGNYQSAFIVIIIYSVIRVYIVEHKLLTFSNFKAAYPIIVGLIAYAILYKLTKNMLGENHWDSRAGLVEDPLLRMREIFSFLPSFFYKNWWVIPKQFGMVLSVASALYIATYLFKSNRLTASLVLIPFLLLTAILMPLALLKVWDPTPRALFSISFLYSSVMILFYNESMVRLKAILLSIAIFLGLISSNSYLYQTEMAQKKDALLAIKSYNLVKSSRIKANRIVIVNDNAINVDSWALNGLIYFLTNENLNISSPTDDEIEQCGKFKNETRLVEGKESLLVCLSN
ncbi:glucosyltransferase domain-containing protein [Pantoea agglomerans]|uniref:glucosyltransferase domain-containing protein n=1 Tax=Enterobacter agglomerans TaxID=549 RepID=UPI001CCC859A|nr:glucosyltransferase domain-containing protein [Pantoea agglomerans]UBN55322.1 glucosyltransferase domain-containing protein [Pantoea agglomerans]